MNIPFTSEQFFDVFKTYNESLFPIQILFYLFGALTIYLVNKPSLNSHRIIIWFLIFFWIWMGVVYHLIFFSSINKAAYLFGLVFILQAGLFYYFGFHKGRLIFKVQWNLYGVLGIFMMVYALIFYPLSAYLLNHVYPSTPTFGLPCPTTIFTFGLLLINNKKCPVILLIIPFVWAIIGSTAAFNLGVKEDFTLLVSALIAVPLIVYHNKKLM